MKSQVILCHLAWHVTDPLAQHIHAVCATLPLGTQWPTGLSDPRAQNPRLAFKQPLVYSITAAERERGKAGSLDRPKRSLQGFL